MNTFRKIALNEHGYVESDIIKVLDGLGKISIPAIGNSGYDVYITVKNKKALSGLEIKVKKILKKEFNSKMIKTDMFPHGSEIQAPWPENKSDDPDKEWELMMSFK